MGCVNLDIKDIKYVATVAQTRNFSMAAKLLYISQPALSQYIHRLENELGIVLFKRTKSKVSLSEFGELFLKNGIPILEDVQNLECKMKELSTLKRSNLKVGMSQFYGKYLLPVILPIFNKLYPYVKIKVVEDVSSILEKKIISDQVDLAIIPLPLSSFKVKYDLIFKEKIKFAVCSSNIVVKKFLNTITEDDFIDLSIFKDEPFIALKSGFKMRNVLESICEEFNFRPNVVLETENLDTVNSLVSRNCGVSILPDIISKYNNVKYFNVNSSFSSRPICVAYKYNKYISKESRDFISILKKYYL